MEFDVPPMIFSINEGSENDSNQVMIMDSYFINL